MPKSNSLTINLPGKALEQPDVRATLAASPRTPLSPRSPHSPAVNGEQQLDPQAQYAEGYDVHVRSPINALPPPPSPKSPKLKTSKIFQNYKASKSSTKVHKSDSPARVGNTTPSDAAPLQVYGNRAAGKSSPDLSNLSSDQPSPQAENTPDLPDDRKDSASAKERDRKRDKHKFGHILGRKASIKDEDVPRTADKASTPGRDKGRSDQPRPSKTQIDMSVKTAPLEKERGFRSAMNSALRNRSLDRQLNDSEDERGPPPSQQSNKPSTLGSNGLPSGSGSSSFIHNTRNFGSKAAEGVNRARKGLFGKLSRSGSSHERELAPKEPYELRVINLPLVEQTRLTRISKRLEKSKDKTEFWMPALPWRCIDYLNLHGTTSEGLYRVPGSDRDIRHWQMKFDKELDINLFDQEELYDINTVSSMFKAWLRQLPEQVFPQEIQNRVIQKCAKAEPAPTSTPQYLKDEISKLPPWNYYLLFAITCHISLLHNCSKDNKMTYGNLCVCFAPCLKIEQWIFQWLILDWKNCWQGCSTEREHLEKEYAILDEMERGRQAGETSSISTTRSKGSSVAGSTVRAVGNGGGRSASARGPDGGGSYVPGRERPLQHFDKHPPPPAAPRDQSQYQQRPATAHANFATDRNISSSESSKPSLTEASSSNGRSTPPDSDLLQSFPRPGVQNSNGSTISRSDERSPNRPATSHHLAQEQKREKSSDRERSKDRSDTPTSKPTPTNKKEKHRPPPMQARTSPERNKGSNEKRENADNGERNGATSTGTSGIGLTAPELSPLKPLSPMALS